MNENAVIAYVEINGYRIATYDDGLMYVTDVSPVGGDSWEVRQVARCFSPEDAAEAHERVTGEIAAGRIPGGCA